MPPRSVFRTVLTLALMAILVALAFLLVQTGEAPGVVDHLGNTSESMTDPGTGTPSPSGQSDTLVALRNPSAQQGDRATDSNTVEGRVVDAANLPLGGVSIHVRILGQRQPAVPPAPGISDRKGHFALELPVGTMADLTFTHPGYHPKNRRVRAPTDPVLVVLDRAPVLRGRVQRQDGTPVAGALVRWFALPDDEHKSGTTHSDQTGRFSFEDLPYTIHLLVLAPGAVPWFRMTWPSWSRKELIVTVDPGRKATGTIVAAESGSPIADARVELWYYKSRMLGDSRQAEATRTRSDGSFTLQKLPSVPDRRRAKAYLWVTAPGWAPHWKFLPLPEYADPLTVSLYRAGSVHGRVLDSEGKPVAGQRVYAEAEVQKLCDAGKNVALRIAGPGYSPEWNTRRPEPTAPFHTEREAFTDDQGNYLIEGIPCPPEGGKVLIMFPADRPRVSTIVRPGEQAEAPDLISPDDSFRHWHGVVRDESGQAIAGATIRLGTSPTMSDAQGRFETRVWAQIQGDLPWFASAPGFTAHRGTIHRSGGVYCKPGEKGLQIILHRARLLSIKVLDRHRRPVPDVRINVCASGSLSGYRKDRNMTHLLVSGSSDDRGDVLLQHVPSSCDILVSYSDIRKILSVTDSKQTHMEIVLDDLDLGGDKADLTLKILDGRTGTPISSRVLVEARSGALERRKLVPGPVIELTDLPHGQWDLSVAAEGLGVANSSVVLVGNKHIEIVLGRGVTIAGRLEGLTASLAQPLEVQAQNTTRKQLTATHTDREGRFRFDGMGPGHYLISVAPFESKPYLPSLHHNCQSHATPHPVKVRVGTRADPAFVMLPVIPVSPLRVVVRAGHTRQSTSWASNLRFTVLDDQGRSVYAGGPSSLGSSQAELLLCLPKRRYKVTVEAQGRRLGQKKMFPGKLWKLDRD